MATRAGFRPGDVTEDEFLSLPDDDDDFHSIQDELRSSSSSVDSVEHVDGQTEIVVSSFMQRILTRNQAIDTRSHVTPPGIDSELGMGRSVEAALGRELANIGDEINERYRSQFDDMLTRLNIINLTLEGAYESFATVARKLFEGGITWGNIVALLCFGYRATVRLAQQGYVFIKKIIHLLVTFIIKENISKWIAAQGGWVRVHTFVKSVTSRDSAFNVIMVAAVTSVALVWLFSQPR